MPPPESVADVEVEPTATIDPTQLSYMIVDNHRFDRNTLNSALRIHHINDIVETDDGAEAFKILRSPTNTVDFILVAQDLPILSGCEFVRLLRRDLDVPYPEVPIIMITGLAAEWIVNQARESGVHDIIAKPFSPDLVFSRIQLTLNHPRPFIRSRRYCGPAPVPSTRG